MKKIKTTKDSNFASPLSSTVISVSPSKAYKLKLRHQQKGLNWYLKSLEHHPTKLIHAFKEILKVLFYCKLLRFESTHSTECTSQ